MTYPAAGDEVEAGPWAPVGLEMANEPEAEVLVAALRFEEALDEARLWARRCSLIEAIAGKGIYAEGHPLDLEKLEQRRVWRRRAVIERRI